MFRSFMAAGNGEVARRSSYRSSISAWQQTFFNPTRTAGVAGGIRALGGGVTAAGRVVLCYDGVCTRNGNGCGGERWLVAEE